MDVESLFALFENQKENKKFPSIEEILCELDAEEGSEPSAYDIKMPKIDPAKKERVKEGTENYKSYQTAKKEIIDGLISLSRSSSVWQVFSDWIAFCANFLSNIYDQTHINSRTEQLMELDKKYSDDQKRCLLELFLLLTKLICRAFESGDLYDFLGEIYEELGLGNNKNGQYFTPREIAGFMGEIVVSGISMESAMEKGFITAMEPASGSGSMVLGFLNSCTKIGLNYKTQCAVLAIDNDIRCVHMCYIQLALYGVPAVVQHGDSLSLQTWSRWYTPVYLMDEWVWRAGLTVTGGKDLENERLKCLQSPLYGLTVYGIPNLASA